MQVGMLTTGVPPTDIICSFKRVVGWDFFLCWLSSARCCVAVADNEWSAACGLRCCRHVFDVSSSRSVPAGQPCSYFYSTNFYGRRSRRVTFYGRLLKGRLLKGRTTRDVIV